MRSPVPAAARRPRPRAHLWRALPALAALVAALVATPARATPWDECLGGGAVSPGDYDCSIVSGGLKRTFRVQIPRGYDSGKPAPVVVVLHGGLGTGRYIQKQSRMAEVADRHGFIALYPDGLYKTWNAGGCCEEAMRRNIDDVGFVRDLLDALARRLAVDPKRVFATGFSNGAMLSHRLACELPERIAAIAPVSGVIMVPECAAAAGVSVMVFHGTDDPRSLWEGGLGDKNPEKGTRESVPVTMGRLHRRYQCVGEAKTTFDRSGVECETRAQCREGVEVALCRVEGGGHQWPGGEAVWPRRLGPINADVSASELMWQFFARHPKR